jgi:hypothetical protein
MNEQTKNQCGSPSRDIFKRKHKDLNKSLWALDVDFVLIEKKPVPDIVAILDFKKNSSDTITFSEVIGYNAFLNRGLPVYIVSGDPDAGAFTIFRYEGGNHLKPTFKLRQVHSTKNWGEFEAWEKLLRAHKQKRWEAS